MMQARHLIIQHANLETQGALKHLEVPLQNKVSQNFIKEKEYQITRALKHQGQIQHRGNKVNCPPC